MLSLFHCVRAILLMVFFQPDLGILRHLFPSRRICGNGQTGGSHHDIFLGFANFSTLSYGLMTAPSKTVVNALSITYNNGAYCGIVQANRASTLYLACNDSMTNEDDVNMVVSESPTCQYQIFAYTKQLCTQLPSPSNTPTMNPTLFPTNIPSIAPTMTPSEIPTCFPTSHPTEYPSSKPSAIPTTISTTTTNSPFSFTSSNTTTAVPPLSKKEITTIVLTVTFSVILLFLAFYICNKCLTQRNKQQNQQHKQVKFPSAPPTVGIVGSNSDGETRRAVGVDEHPTDSVVAIQSANNYEYF